MSYAARTKYDESGRAARYAERSPGRAEAEWRLLARSLDGLDPAPASALDVPCGVGRIAARLVERGLPTHLADLSPAMRAQARARMGEVPGVLGVHALDLEAVPTESPLAADLVVCFRFLHHLPDEATRHRVLCGLRRLTKRDLLLSFHHPVSAHNARRVLRRWLGGPVGDRHTLSVGRLRREAAAAGLCLVGSRALAAWRREFWVAHLQPVPPAVGRAE